MKILIVYDSFFGNTEQVAREIGNSFGSEENVKTQRVGDITPGDLTSVDMLIVGSPTRAFRPSEAIGKFLKTIPSNSLKNIKVAAFDTRISVNDTNSKFLKFMVKIFGYAAKPIADKLKKKGGDLIISPEGFYVKDTEGPLKDGEPDRASAWLRQMNNRIK